METTNASSFFQTEEATKNAARQVAKSGNTLGNPLVFSTKILSVTPDRSRPDSWVYITESGSVSQETNIETGEKFTLKGHIAPVTCLEVFGERIYTASWDKTIRIYDKASRRCLKVLQAHTDFVKCMLMVPHLNILLSGSSDRCIKAWDLDSYDCLYTLKSHPRGIESLALSPSGILYSAGSESSIRMWNLTRTGGKEIKEPFWGHDTSVYRLLFAEDTLWTASADKTARQWTEDLKQEMRFEHPDYVRDVLVHHNYLITACRDENIRFFDIGTGKLKYTLEGHFGEVSGLAVVGQTLISVSLDCTMRRWTLTESGLKAHVKEQASWKPKEVQAEEVSLSAEEEAELAELMAE